MLISIRVLNGDDVELEELDRVGGPIITRADVRPKLVWPDHVALLTSESEAPGVVDELPSNLDVLASSTDVVEGAVMIFSAALEGDACVFWRRWTIWQLGSPHGEDAAQEAAFLV
jgi:hypothetical protein